MARRGLSPYVAKTLGLAAGATGRQEKPGRRLPSLPGIGLERLTEEDLQKSVVRDLRRAGLYVLSIPNQRTIRHLPDAAAHRLLSALVASGMVVGASDLLVVWDVAKGAPGNRGVCWIELKRPVKPSPVSPEQDQFITDQRALGFVAGVAQSYEQAEALLVEAGAPLRFRTTWPVPAAETVEAPGVATPSASYPKDKLHHG